MIQPTIYKIIENENGGFLAIMAKPVAGEWIEDEFAGLAGLCVQTLVSLLERAETRELGLEDEQALCKKNFIDFIQHPTPDRCVPDNASAFKEMVDDLFNRFESGQGVAVHCRAGIGRSGMTTIAVLVRYGLSVDDAITLVSQARSIPVPDTEEQIDWLYDHYG